MNAPPPPTSITDMTFKYDHNANGDLICPHCGITKPADKVSTMSMHKRVCEGNLPHACSHCDYRCLSGQRLKDHIAAKHPETEEAKAVPHLKCPVDGCTFKTFTKGNRIIHFMRKHCIKQVLNILQTSDTTFDCKQCNKKFNSNTAFQYHVAECITLTDITLSRHLRTVLA